MKIGVGEFGHQYLPTYPWTSWTRDGGLRGGSGLWSYSGTYSLHLDLLYTLVLTDFFLEHKTKLK